LLKLRGCFVLIASRNRAKRTFLDERSRIRAKLHAVKSISVQYF